MVYVFTVLLVFIFNIRALIATITVLAAINAAPTAGVSTTPHA